MSVRQRVMARQLPQWASIAARDSSAIHIDRGEGCWLHGPKGKWLDWSSQAVCCNLGHSQPAIMEAVTAQMRKVPMLESRFFYSDVNAEVCDLLHSKLNHTKQQPELTRFYFPESGANAVDAACRLSKHATGRSKIMASYRGYHGGTGFALTVTGGWDIRKECLIAPTPGVVHFLSPDPYHEIWSSTEQCLQYFRELVQMEGPNSIAAVIIETIPGATGVVQPAPEYLQGVQAICREHGIVLIADEVMSGFCRTGKWFGFEHAGLSPDIVTMAKGITGAAVPLGAVAVTETIAACFQDSMLPCGSTYNAHPISLAAASAAIKLYDTLDILNHMESLRPTIADRRAKLLKHASCFDARFVGLHGCVEVRLPEEGAGAAIEAAKAMMLERGLWSLVRLNTNTQRMDILSSPPLIVTADELNFAFDILEEVLGSMDQKL